MNINTVVKLAYAINAGCAIALVGINAYANKKQLELNRTIAEGHQKIAEGNLMMQNWHREMTS